MCLGSLGSGRSFRRRLIGRTSRMEVVMPPEISDKARFPRTETTEKAVGRDMVGELVDV